MKKDYTSTKKSTTHKIIKRKGKLYVIKSKV